MAATLACNLLTPASPAAPPLKLPPDMKFMEMFHAHDERAPVEGLGWGVRVLYDVVVRYCA